MTWRVGASIAAYRLIIRGLSSRRRINYVLAAAAAIEVAIVLLLPAPKNPDKPGVWGGIATAAAQLRGEGPPVDLVQDYVGARRLIRGGDTYPVLTKAFASVGIEWRADHRSTHPPTAFALLLPVAWLSWKIASAVWAFLMLCAIGAAFWAYGARPALAAALAPLALLWPPAAWSLGQLTPVWLLGLALAWRLRNRPARAGAAVAFASLTKLLPTLSLVPLLVVESRRWRTLRGFLIVWAGALAVLLLARPSAVTRYADIVTGVGDQQAGRGENSALLWAAAHRFGAAGVAVALALVAATVTASLQSLRASRHLDRWSWDAWSWVGVALLPIGWIYSLLPLAPALARILRRGSAVPRLFASVALLMPFFVDPFGLPSGIRLACSTASAGVALLVSGPAVVSRRRRWAPT